MVLVTPQNIYFLKNCTIFLDKTLGIWLRNSGQVRFKSFFEEVNEKSKGELFIPGGKEALVGSFL